MLSRTCLGFGPGVPITHMGRSKHLGLYVLRGKLAVPVSTMEEWAKKFDGRNRIVAQTRIGGVFISTVFLGIDHSFDGGLPLIFETMALACTAEAGEVCR